MTETLMSMSMIRYPEDYINNQELLKDYYYNQFIDFMYKTDKNIKYFKYVLSDEVKDFHLVINRNRIIIKKRGMFYNNIRDFEDYMFSNFYKYSTVASVSAKLIPIMVTDDYKEKILDDMKNITDVDELMEFKRVYSIYLEMDSYYKLSISLNGVGYEYDNPLIFTH